MLPGRNVARLRQLQRSVRPQHGDACSEQLTIDVKVRRETDAPAIDPERIQLLNHVRQDFVQRDRAPSLKLRRLFTGFRSPRHVLRPRLASTIEEVSENVVKVEIHDCHRGSYCGLTPELSCKAAQVI
jgi:hypothetical protein